MRSTSCSASTDRPAAASIAAHRSRIGICPAGGQTGQVPDPFGVYVHVPFCARRCDYCAFATWTDRHHLTEAYLAALRVEIALAVGDGMPAATSVFVGGGTPSMVPGATLVDVLTSIPLADGAEVSIECNPDNVTADLLRTYRDGPVNRLSFGVQSMVPHVLAKLGRTHDPDNVRRAVELARSTGFESFNLDLIYGTVGESLDDWERTVVAALELEPPHVSAYGLTVEAGTPLWDDPARHPDDDDQADKYELADDVLSSAGLGNYEISNWAVAGHECRHNLVYWTQGDYLGFGCAAHSHRSGRRWWNVRTPERYLALIEEGQPAEAAGEDLGAEARRVEGLQLSLRTKSGVPVDALDADDLPGLVELVDERLVLTRRGRLMANEVSLRLR
jgi:putative oxygen-independent coproporphyrinogen III oxidase